MVDHEWLDEWYDCEADDCLCEGFVPRAVDPAPLGETTPAPSERRNWPEDFAHENGQYENRCHACRYTFIGHKRRTTCRVCAQDAAAPSTSGGLRDE